MTQDSIKLGISAFAWTANFTPAHLKILSEVRGAGLDGFEVPMFDPRTLPLADIKSAVDEHGLDCTVCALLPQDCNPISPDSALRGKAVEHLKRCIDASVKMGASLLGGPLVAPIGYLPQHRPSAQEWEWAVEVFQTVCRDLKGTPLTISIEPVNRSETFFIRTAEEAKRFCEAVGDARLGVTVDTFHANIEEARIPDAILSLGGRLKHVHASETNRGPLGTGHMSFAEIVSALRDIDYAGYLMIEGFGYDPKEQSAPGWLWAALEDSPAVVLNQSATYLKRLLDGVHA
jgi:D-psicose/D-tagatose/L-ribulose 3-epimerase